MQRSLLAVLSLCLLSPFASAEATNANVGEVQLTREGRAAIQLGLQFLAARQRPDGSIGGEAYGNSTAGVTAACLAWMAEGSLPGEGPYGKNVAKGIDFLLRSAQPSGMLGRPGDSSYCHGMAAICLAEAWGQTRDKNIYKKLKQAIEVTIRTQNDKGGWRYWQRGPRIEDDDLSTTVMQLMALRAAYDAGIAVPKEVIDKSVRYVESCRSQKDNEGYAGFSYSPGGNKTWSCTALGVMSLMLCGNVKAKDVKDGLEFLYISRQRKQDTNFFVYGHYYGAMAMYRAGGQDEKFRDYWLKWYPDISKTLIKSQITSGAARGKFNIEGNYGAWAQGMCAVILAIPYRYLPVYQR